MAKSGQFPKGPGVKARYDAFIAAFKATRNARQSAIAAGYAPKSAAVTGAKLLGLEYVKREIEKHREAEQARAEVTAERIVAEHALIAFADITDFATWDRDGVVQFLESSKLRQGLGRCIKSLTHTRRTYPDGSEENRVALQLWEKSKSLESLAKRIRFYPPEKREVSGPGGGPIEIKEMASTARDELAAALGLDETPGDE